MRAGTYRLSLKRLDRTRALNATPNARSLSRIRYFGVLSHGNASVIWRASHSAVGLRVTANHSNRRRSCPRTRNAKSCWNAIVGTTNSLGRRKQRHVPTSAFTPRSRAHLFTAPNVASAQKVADLHKNPRGNLEQYSLSAISASAERAVAALVPR